MTGNIPFNVLQAKKIVKEGVSKNFHCVLINLKSWCLVFQVGRRVCDLSFGAHNFVTNRRIRSKMPNIYHVVNHSFDISVDRGEKFGIRQE